MLSNLNFCRTFNNWNSDRVIRDNDGNDNGYAALNSNGVTYIYDLGGNREGYVR